MRSRNAPSTSVFLHTPVKNKCSSFFMYCMKITVISSCQFLTQKRRFASEILVRVDHLCHHKNLISVKVGWKNFFLYNRGIYLCFFLRINDYIVKDAQFLLCNALDLSYLMKFVNISKHEPRQIKMIIRSNFENQQI